MSDKQKDGAGFFTEYLGEDEVRFSKHAAQQLQGIPWTSKLLNDPKISSAINHVPNPNRTLTEIRKLKAAYFEIRFAYALHKRGLKPDYEYSAGVGKTSIDFNIHSNPNWLIELTSLSEGVAVKNATTQSDNGISTFFSETKPGEISPEVIEIIRAQRAFCSKVIDEKGNPTKFPNPTSERFHMILLDARSYNAGMVDHYDYLNIAYGSKVLTNIAHGFLCRYWKDDLIKGLFDSQHPEPNSKFIREKIHALGFVAEAKFEDDFLIQNLTIIPNPLLFSSKEEFQKALPKELQKHEN